MHVLSTQDYSLVSAAGGGDAFLGAALAIVGLSILMSEDSYDPYYYYPTSYYAFETPVYDSWGRYQGQMVVYY